MYPGETQRGTYCAAATLTFYLSATSGTKGTDVRGWVTRVSASNSIKHTDRSLTILLRILEAVDGTRESGQTISCERVDVPVPAGLSTGSRGTGFTVARAEDTSGVCAGNLDINGIRCQNTPRIFDQGHEQSHWAIRELSKMPLRMTGKRLTWGTICPQLV